MARYACALVLPLLLLACALLQGSYGSRSPPEEPQKPAEEVLSPVVHGAAGPRHGDDGTEGATGHRTGGDAGAAAAAASALGAAVGVGSAQMDGRAVVQQVLRTSAKQLARRVLQGGTAADSAAGSSCRSHDARVTCPPPALH